MDEPVPESVTQFGKYLIETNVGQGGFGTVYRAIDETLDRPVALKILEPILLRDEIWVSRFRREARLMAKLDHPHIVPIYEIDEVDGQLFIAMKFIDGLNLAQRIKRDGRLPWPLVTSIMSQVADALDYAYTLEIVHRDLKPANILLKEDRASLTDFGFARLVGDNTQSLTMSGGVVGTPAYIAPEVWEGKPQGPAGDIYALGCVLYEMVTGEVLFTGTSTPSIMMAHFRPPPLPSRFPEDIPPAMLSVLEKALSREPAERYESASAMLQALTPETQQVEVRGEGERPLATDKPELQTTNEEEAAPAANAFIEENVADEDLPQENYASPLAEFKKQEEMVESESSGSLEKDDPDGEPKKPSTMRTCLIVIGILLISCLLFSICGVLMESMGLY